MDTSARPALPALALLFNATVWGLVWLPFKALQQLGLHPLWATALIYLAALAGLLLWRPRSLRHLARQPHLLGLALAAGLTNVCFNWAITAGDVVRVTLLFYMMPVWSIALAWPLLNERPTPMALLRVVLALGGVLLVLHRPGTAWPLPRELADFLALAGGFCFAVTNILVRRWRDTPEEGRVLSMFLGGLTVATALAFSGAGGPWPGLQPAWLPWVLGVGAAFVAGNLALQYGAARLRAAVTALIMLTEVLIATLSSSLLGAAHPTPVVWLGGGLIVLAAALAVRRG
ncbi:MAG TPA: DMT family transporter [Ottowia sp.]|uniref:DMT family transporter n=1 Tax=Ottowia sp. TaxID=1898956 RepID=UPI002CC59488|nr:DMT family transporter [Ottowia sp.]HMN19941.1 DMT family transporter [Ottowia sp.]